MKHILQLVNYAFVEATQISGVILELGRKSIPEEVKSTQAEDGYLLIRLMVLLL